MRIILASKSGVRKKILNDFKIDFTFLNIVNKNDNHYYQI